jgi:hypothetical protein
VKHEPIVSAPPVRAFWLPWVVLALGAPALFLLPITHDAIWQIWLGRQMLGGAELYRDIIEVNPPLWFWMAEPLAALGADPRLTVIGFFIATMAVSLFLTPPRFRLPAAAVMLLVPLHDFGQREHFTLLATIPYVFAVATRARRETPRFPVLVGLLAALGICLKPHFLLVPLALELLVHRGGHVRAETVTLALGGLAYAAAIPIFAPAYFMVALPIVMRFYGAFGQAHPNYIMLAAAFVLAAAGAWGGRRKGSIETRALVLASLAFVPAVLIQDKGFAYHSLPARGLLALAAIVELVRLRDSPWADGLLVGTVVLCCWPFGFYVNPWRAEAEFHFAGIPRGSSVIVLASNPSAAWPMVEEHGFRWGLHQFSTWQVNAVIRNPALLPDARRIVAPDLAKRPDLLIVDHRPVLGSTAAALMPPGYLRCYSLWRQSTRLRSYRRVC